MQQIRILHLLKSNQYSGAENVVVQIIKMFKNKQNMYYCSPDGPISQSLYDKNIDFIPINNFNPITLYRLIKKYNINIIHAHDPGACVLAAFVPKRIKIIAHVHGNHDNMKKITIKSFLFLILSFRFSKIIWVSESSLKDYFFKKCLIKKSIVLVNTINEDDIRASLVGDDKLELFDCIYLGRLSQEKNPLRAIEVIKTVANSIPNYKAVFVGNGLLLDDCLKLVKKYNLENNIIFKGYLSNPLPILNNSKVLLMTSKYEGTPMSALEAMCLGKPIISTPTDGLLNLIETGITGYYSNDNSQLASYLIDLKKDNKHYDAMSTNTLKRFKKINDVKRYKNKYGQRLNALVRK